MYFSLFDLVGQAACTSHRPFNLLPRPAPPRHTVKLLRVNPSQFARHLKGAALPRTTSQITKQFVFHYKQFRSRTKSFPSCEQILRGISFVKRRKQKCFFSVRRKEFVLQRLQILCIKTPFKLFVILHSCSQEFLSARPARCAPPVHCGPRVENLVSSHFE